MDKTERSRALARMNDEASTSGQVPEQCSETPEKVYLFFSYLLVFEDQIL